MWKLIKPRRIIFVLLSPTGTHSVMQIQIRLAKAQEVVSGIKRPTRLKMRSTAWKQGSSFLQNWVHPIGASTTGTLHQKEQRSQTSEEHTSELQSRGHLV